jgi:hypothetical protein
MSTENVTNTLKQRFLFFSFIFLGIGAIISWNSILSCMDFFIKFVKVSLNLQQADFSPQFWFPNLNSILSTIFQFILLFFGKYFKFKTLLTFAYTLNGLGLAILPFIVINIPNLPGFLLTCFVVLLFGKVNC